MSQSQHDVKKTSLVKSIKGLSMKRLSCPSMWMLRWNWSCSHSLFSKWKWCCCWAMLRLVTKILQIYVKRRSLSFVNIQLWTLYPVLSWLSVKSKGFGWDLTRNKMSNKLNKQSRTKLNEVAKIVTKPSNLSATEITTILDKVDQVKCEYLFYLFLVSSLDNNFDK